MPELWTLGIVNRLPTILTLLSAVIFCFLVVMWPASYYLNLSRGMGSGKLVPSDSVPITPHYRLGFEDGGMWLYTYEMPWKGGTYALTTTNDPPPYRWFCHIGDYGFGHEIIFGHEHLSVRSCQLPGIYFLRMWRFDDNPPYTTLMMSLWYPILLLAVLPALWFYRRRHFWFWKP